MSGHRRRSVVSSGYGSTYSGSSIITGSRSDSSIGSIKSTHHAVPHRFDTMESSGMPATSSARSRLIARGVERLDVRPTVTTEPTHLGRRLDSSESSSNGSSGSMRGTAPRFPMTHTTPAPSGYLARSNHSRAQTTAVGSISSTRSPSLYVPTGGHGRSPASEGQGRESGAEESVGTAAGRRPSFVKRRSSTCSSTESSSDESDVSPARSGGGAQAQLPSSLGSMTVSLQRKSSLDWVSQLPPGGGAKGLANLGNTCFMNSILQCLAATPELVRQFVAAGALPPGCGPVASAFSDLLEKLWGPGGACVTPQKFLDQVTRRDRRWSGGRQQDSLEFLQFLLGALQVDTNRVKGKPKYQELSGKGTEGEQAREAWEYARQREDSVINDIFGGMLQSVVTCVTCHHTSNCFDPICDLSVPITGRSCDVSDCLESFTEVESLGKADGYRCEKCKCTVRATKQLLVYTLPKVLIIHLKRFSSSSSLGRFSSLSKNTSAVKLVTRGLDMSPYCNPKAIKAGSSATFDLIGVSNHSGNLGGGHYTALCKNFQDGKWYDFNDSHVSVSREPNGASQSAYVLFYRRRD